MNTELVCASCQRFQFQQGMGSEPADNAEAGMCIFPIIHDSPAGPFIRLMTDRGDYFTFIPFDYPTHRSQIEFLYPSETKMFRESAMRAWCLGDNDHTGSVTIESMNQTRTERCAVGLPEVKG